jgi:hypothetical protein
MWMMSDREMPASYNNESLGNARGGGAESSLMRSSSSSVGGAAPSSPPSSTSEDVPSKTPARNLPWQRHFKLRIAPLCLEVLKDTSGYLTFEQALANAALKEIPKVVVTDCNRPPSNLAYNVITLAIAAGGPTSGSSSASMMEQMESGLYLVREISSVPLLPENNILVINERLFMDKTREMYKSKGWGTANWRFWLALEDVDVMQKRRNKRAILDKRKMAKSLDSGARGSIDESESLPSAPEMDHPSGIVIHHNDTAAQLAHQHRKKAKEVQPEFPAYFQPPPTQLFQPLPQLSQLSISPAPTPYMTSPHLPPTVSPASMMQRHMQASLLSMPPMPSFQNRPYGFPSMIPPPPHAYGPPFGPMLSPYPPPSAAGMMQPPQQLQRSNSSSGAALFKPAESTNLLGTSSGGVQPNRYPPSWNPPRS